MAAKTYGLGKILVVDDDSDFCSAVGAAIENDGRFRNYEILYSGDGEDALRQYDNYNPDAIILDVMLPKRSGFLVLERIRGLLKDRDTSVIIVTANQGTRHRMHAESIGVEGYLNKPFRMEDLTGLLSSCLFGEKSDNHISR